MKLSAQDLKSYRIKTVLWSLSIPLLMVSASQLPSNASAFIVLNLVPVISIAILLSLFIIEGLLLYDKYSKYSEKFKVLCSTLSFSALLILNFAHSLVKDFIALQQGYNHLYSAFPAYSKLDDAFTLISSTISLVLIYYAITIVIQFCAILLSKASGDELFSKFCAFLITGFLWIYSMSSIVYIPQLAYQIQKTTVVCNTAKADAIGPAIEGKYLVLKESTRSALLLKPEACELNKAP